VRPSGIRGVARLRNRSGPLPLQSHDRRAQRVAGDRPEPSDQRVVVQSRSGQRAARRKLHRTGELPRQVVKGDAMNRTLAIVIFGLLLRGTAAIAEEGSPLASRDAASPAAGLAVNLPLVARLIG